jgi:FlaA1/EpsC-like NDP-sugar epimerase
LGAEVANLFKNLRIDRAPLSISGVLIRLHDLSWVVALWWVLFRYGNISSLDAWFNLITGLAIFIISFESAGLYRGMWRFASVPDLINILKAVLIGSVIWAVLILALGTHGLLKLPYLLLFPPALVTFLSGPRFLYRHWKSQSNKSGAIGARRILLIGAGQRTENFVRQTLNDQRFVVVGILDDRKELRGMSIYNVRVLGKIKQLKVIAEETASSLIIVATDELSPTILKKVVADCDELKISFKRLPSINEILDVDSELPLQDIRIEDLLGRTPVKFDMEQIERYMRDRKIVITGAAGSIGSEIARLVAKTSIDELILIDINENLLHNLGKELGAKHPKLTITPILGNCSDAAVLRKALANHVDYVFHAAAYKQVPVLENQVRAAIENNVISSYKLAKACVEHKVSNLVLISTDKAVEPVNVLGASKRLAEIFCLDATADTSTNCSIIRFGNVLDSIGSVVPLFRDQIAHGGPVTVTHPDVTRFFMTIPEASRLILQAMTLPKNDAKIYSLDMGEPVKIADLAAQMIALSGKMPGRDISIEYVGLRPGEKLHEKLFHPDEILIPTSHPRILCSHPRVNSLPADKLASSLMEACTNFKSEAELQELLMRTLDDYKPLTVSTQSELQDS